MEQDRYNGKGRFPHRKRGDILNFIIILLFISLLPPLLPSFQTSVLLAIVGFTAIVALTFSYFRIWGFIGLSLRLSSGGSYSFPPASRERRLGILIAVLAFLFSPFIAAGFVDPFLWIISMGGVICGVNLGELLFTLHVRRWESQTGQILRSYEVLSDSSQSESIHESGVKAEKRPVSHAGETTGLLQRLKQIVERKSSR